VGDRKFRQRDLMVGRKDSRAKKKLLGARPQKNVEKGGGSKWEEAAVVGLQVEDTFGMTRTGGTTLTVCDRVEGGTKRAGKLEGRKGGNMPVCTSPLKGALIRGGKEAASCGGEVRRKVAKEGAE